MTGIGIGVSPSIGKGGVLTPFSFPRLESWHDGRGGILTTGSGVETWDDRSGKGRDLTQSTDNFRPSDTGNGSVLFDGVDEFLSVGFTLVQPHTIYIFFRQITWVANARIFDGVTGSALLFQAGAGASPEVAIFAGQQLSTTSSLVLNTFGVMACVFNGANSFYRLDDSVQHSGNAGGGNPGGITLGANNAGGQHSNIEVRQILSYSAAHNLAHVAGVTRMLQGFYN